VRGWDAVPGVGRAGGEIGEDGEFGRIGEGGEFGRIGEGGRIGEDKEIGSMEIGSFIGHFRAASKDVGDGGASLESGGNHGGGASGSGGAWVPPPASVLFDPTRDILFNAPFTREQYNLVVDGSKQQQLARDVKNVLAGTKRGREDEK